MEHNITLLKGLGFLRFHMPVEEAVALMGQADEVENTENAADEPTTILRYNELGLTLFFEGENPTLACIDTCNEETTLFGEEVFNLNERQIVQLLVRNDYTEQDADEEDWGERRISFPEGNIDFYFYEGALASIIIGA